MEIREDLRYEGDADRVFALFSDEAFLRKKYGALGHTNFQVLECAQKGDVFTIKTRRDVPVAVPGFAAKVIKPVNTVTQTEEWNVAGPIRQGKWKVEAPGVPIHIGGTMRLVPQGAASTHEIRGEVKVSIPLIGKKIAEFVGGDAAKSVREEYRVTKEALAG